MVSALFLSLMLAAPTVSGIVKDTTGGAVAGASVVLKTSSGTEQTVTGPDGRFTLNKTPEGQATLVVKAGGFAEKEQPVSGSGDIEIVLSPAALMEVVTVTPSRSEEQLGNIPASINIIDSEDIKQSPALVADDILRRLPTFSLFRRTSSLSSHPTSQGVSLRGIGPSGVSRTLVMVDSVPFNDPFGGWVYWTRVPTDAVDRIEDVDGPSSSLYGNYAMGGVINIMSSRAARRTLELKTQYGNHNSPKIDYSGSDVWGKFSAVIDGSYFDTDGFPIVVENERGPIDNNATVKFANTNLRLEYAPSSRVRVFGRGGYFSEDRGNGKIGEVNDTQWTSVSGGTHVLLPDGSALTGSVFTDFEHFHSTFLAVTAPSATVPPRSIVRLTTDQHVPTNAAGGMVQWNRAFRFNVVSGGADYRWVDGDSEEDAYNAPAGVPVVPPVAPTVLALQRVSGGTQRSIGAFVQDVYTPVEKLAITASARFDSWKNYDGHNLETNVPSGTPGAGNRPTIPDQSDNVVSPRVAALYHFNDKVRVWGGYSTGFRAPTLNELYRQFRVGAVLTLANDALGPEHLKGGELGITVSPKRNLIFRSTYYDNRVKDPVSNVTIATNVMQRQNLGRTRIRGLQTDGEVTIAQFVRVSAGYLFNDAKVTEFAANPGLVGLYLPQVPKNRGNFQVAYSNPRYLNAGVGVQFVGRQFDDDQNVRTVPGETEPGLPGYTLMDLTFSRSFGRNVDAYFGVQNTFNTEYIVMTLPTTTGSPRLVNGGVRIRWAGR